MAKQRGGHCPIGTISGQVSGSSDQPDRETSVLVTKSATHTAISKWTVAGDANGDCAVNVLDLIFIRNRLNQDVNSGENWLADVNADGKINVLDLIYVRNRLNTQCP